jgi:hypothetical protein
MAPTGYIKCISGRFCDAVGEQFKLKFCTYDEDDYIDNDVYCSGKNKYEIGKSMHEFMQKLEAYGDGISMCMDHDRYDLHHTGPMFALQWKFFNKLVHPTNRVLQWQINEMEMNGQFMSYSIKFWNMICRGSGGGETTTGNTFLNVVSARFCWFKVLEDEGLLHGSMDEKIEQFKLVPIYTHYLGDDNATICPKLFAKFAEAFQNYMSRLGWSLKLDIKDIPNLEFCSSYYVPCDVWKNNHWEQSHVLLNKPGRILMKFGHSIKPRGKLAKQLGYLRAILLGFKEQDCIAFMKSFRLRLLTLIDAKRKYLGLSDANWQILCTRQMNKWYVESRAQYRATGIGVDITRENQHTRQWIKQVYSINDAEIDSLSNYFDCMDCINIYIEHPVIECILNKDTFNVCE